MIRLLYQAGHAAGRATRRRQRWRHRLRTEAVREHDAVINLAGTLGTAETVDDPCPSLETNVRGALNILEADLAGNSPKEYEASRVPYHFMRPRTGSATTRSSACAACTSSVAALQGPRREDRGRGRHRGRSLAYQRLMHELYAVQRRAVVELRDRGDISNDVMHRIERELDLEESRLAGGVAGERSRLVIRGRSGRRPCSD